MIDGYFGPFTDVPLVDVIMQFPTLGGRYFRTRMVVDTGGYHCALGAVDVFRLERLLGIDVAQLGLVRGSIAGATGVGSSWEIPCRFWLSGRFLDLPDLQLLPRLDGTQNPAPSFLGRPILSQFTVMVDRRRNLVSLSD
jgi:hypothetical protein